MRDALEAISVGLLALVIFLSLFAIKACNDIGVRGDSYRQGQIDALTGKIKYELLPQPDGTVVWVEKEAKP